MSGYNGGGYPPPGQYSPTAPYGGGDTPYRPPPPPTGFPPFPPPGARPPFPGSRPPPPPQSYRSPYDEYNPSGPSTLPPPPQKYSYDQPRKSFDQDVYDPYQPAAYDPGAPSLGAAPSPYNSSLPPPPPSLSSRPMRSGSEMTDLPILTAPSRTDIGNFNATVYSLPESHLPITKYVPVNPEEAVDIHRALCQSGVSTSVWYADGSNRAGEGWVAAVEWVLDTGMSGAKGRACVGNVDSLGTELGALIKAVETFRDQLQHSIRAQKPISHELVLFCSSAAAIVSIDTSSRPESIRFCQMWREICIDYLRAHLTLAWLPKGNTVEGFVLAEKIANVAASNSYQKRRKDRMIDDIYNRPGGGDPAPGGSTEAGPWQRGDADPSRRKSPFERPKPLPPVASASPERKPFPLPPKPAVAPPVPTPQPERPPVPVEPPQPAPMELLPVEPENEDEGIQPRAGALCVTDFPDDASAKDLGILFAQFGEITSVDIFSIPPVKPRFAFVAYAEPSTALPAAIEILHHQAINLDSQFGRDNAVDLAIWKDWPGRLTVVESDPERLVPLSIAKDLPELADYATSIRRSVDPAAVTKRERSADKLPSPSDSPSPKRQRHNGLPDTSSEVKTTSSNAHRSLLGAPPPHLSSKPAISTNNHEGRPMATPPPNNLAPHSTSHPLPPTPLTASRHGAGSPHVPSSDQLPVSNSASEPQEHPIKLSGQTLRAQIDLLEKVFVKHELSNWIAHTCLIATDLDQVRRQLQQDLYHTDEAFLTGRDLEQDLSARGFSRERIDAFIAKVLKVLDGIAMADELESGGPPVTVVDDIPALQLTLAKALEPYPLQTRESMTAAATVLEYLHRGREAQEKKRLDVERRVKVLEGMAKIGEKVSEVVRFLLTDG